MNDEDWAALKRYNDALTKLLEDPHPGLSSWVVMVLKTIEKIAEFGGYK